MRSVAVVNQKGGSAKTTTSVSLAAALGELARSVLLVDLDPAGSASRWVGRTTGEAGLFNLLVHEQGSLDDLAVPTGLPGVELVSASSGLNAADMALGGAIGGQLRLRQALFNAKPRDFVVFDCPPGLGLMVINALAAAGEVLIPVPTRTLELDGLADLMGTITKARGSLNPELRIAGVLPVRFHEGPAVDAQVVGALRRQFSAELLPVVIHESVRFGELRSRHLSISQHEPRGRGAREYAEVAQALLDREAAHVN